MRKIWVDVETTGTDPKNCAIVQLAAICEDDEFHSFVNPHPGAVFEAGALLVNDFLERMGRPTIPEDDPAFVSTRFLLFMNKQQKLNNGYKLTLCGHNPQFDLDFLDAFFDRCGIKKFRETVEYKRIDTFAIAAALQDKRVLELRQKLSLSGLCQTFGVKQENAHDALSDIRATKELYQKMIGRL